MRKYFTPLLLCLALPLFAQTNKETKRDSTASRLAELMQTYHDYKMFDGVVLVAENGKVVYKAAFGMANREWNIPNATDTKFMIGSVSKPFTAMLVLLQVQKGVLHLDSALAKYLPEFSGKPAAKVTLRQILSHTSGIPNYDIMKDFFPAMSRRNFSRSEYLKIYMDSALAFAPGTKYYYSSWGYFTLGHVVERVTGKSYADVMKEEIFDKIGMKNSGSYYHTQLVSKRATGYDYALGAFSSSDFRDQSNTMGTGDMYSTVEDLFLFHLALQNHTLLNPQLTLEMLKPGINPANYGFGWFNKSFKISPTDSVASNFHLGSTDGFISFVRRIPATNSFVAILCNSAPTDFFGITSNLVKTLYQQSITLKKPVHKAMEVLIAQHGTAKAVAEFPAMKADTAHFSTDWISMNYLVEQLASQKRLEEARILAESNAVAFANKDLIMLTLGNIYLALNRKADAITYFKKVLEITPDYAEAINRLRELERK